jgi:ADP-heptose:LPS heptosyltransferase
VDCWIQAPRALAALLQRSFPRARVVPPDRCPAEVELRIPVMSLPLAMKTFSESEIPRGVPYLVVDEREKAQWTSRLGTRRKHTVGLVWRGLKQHRNDHNRSIGLEALMPLLGRKQIQFIGLQKELTRAESEELSRHDNVMVLDGELGSFDDTAAVVSALDVVISADSSPAHLSGALGKPTWILLPFSPDWRWLLARSDSPWYPTARLFRQESIGDWAAVIDRVGESLDQLSL